VGKQYIFLHVSVSLFSSCMGGVPVEGGSLSYSWVAAADTDASAKLITKPAEPLVLFCSSGSQIAIAASNSAATGLSQSVISPVFHMHIPHPSPMASVEGQSSSSHGNAATYVRPTSASAAVHCPAAAAGKHAIKAASSSTSSSSATAAAIDAVPMQALPVVVGAVHRTQTAGQTQLGDRLKQLRLG
jgi:hypothetical protein